MNKILLCLLALCILLGALCIHLPDRFSPDLLVQGIEHEFPHHECANLHEILSQPFSYLGKGSQAIAFASADGKYVLKFFLTNRFHTGLRIRRPFKKTPPFRIRGDVLERYASAFEKIQEETALIAMHLSATKDHLPRCVLQDPQGHQHTIDLNRFSFLVQKKCTCLSTHFAKLPLEKKESLRQKLQELLTSLARKGFYNLRGSFKEQNFAFCEDEVYIIDIGNFVFREEIAQHPLPEIQRSEKALQHWRN